MKTRPTSTKRHLGLFVCISATVMSLAAGFFLTARPASAISMTAVVREINVARKDVNARRLFQSTTLYRAAVAKTQSMFRDQYFGHTSPSGQRFWSWLGSRREMFTRYGENLAYGYRTERGLLAAWLRSSGHRANVLDQRFTHVGVGIRSGQYRGKRVTMIVALFGTKRGSTPLTTSVR